MRRYKREDAFERILKKYKYTYSIGFILLFLALTFLLGLSAYIAISSNYLSSAKTSVKSFINSVVDNNRINDNFPPGEPGGEITEPEDRGQNAVIPQDPRMVAQYFYNDSSTGEVKSVILGLGNNSSSNIKEAYTYAYDVRDFNEDCRQFKVKDINGFSTLTYTEKVDSNSNLKINVGLDRQKVTYIKVYMNVEGEESTRTQFINIYLVCVFVVLVLSIAAGTIMARQSIKPLRAFVKKQIDFVNDASHELRTPLAVVQSKIENILANPNQSVFEASESLAISLNEINRLSKLTSELLTLARNDKDNIRLNLDEININDALKKIVEPFLEIAQIQDRRLNYVGCQDEIYAYLDLDKFKQIIIINIDNALKYTEAGDDINISLYATNSEFTIEIADTGIGISEQTKEHIFERFYREDKARSRETGGTGLGLAIAYTLTNLQKGRISVDHNMPKGTKFNITFPRLKNPRKEDNKNETTNE